MENKFINLGLNLLDLFFPPNCPGCGQLGIHWCDNCNEKVKRILPPMCKKCGVPLPFNDTACSCSQTIQHLDQIRSYSIYASPLSLAIRQYKYHRNFALANSLAIYLHNMYNEYKLESDLIIPVPLNKNKLRERGFNQAGLLAKNLADKVSLPYETQALFRIKETLSQARLTRQERLINVNEAFLADASFVKNKNIIIVDDVVTTGATLEACANALKSAGAKVIVALSLARAVPTSNGFSDYENNLTSV